jgi:hypothetical protein
VGPIEILSGETDNVVQIVNPPQFHEPLESKLSDPNVTTSPIKILKKENSFSESKKLEKKTPSSFLSPETAETSHVPKKVQSNAKLLFIPKNDTYQQLMINAMLHPRLQ